MERRVLVAACGVVVGLAMLPTAAAVQPAPVLERGIPPGIPVYCGGARKPYVALTFDDGPGAYTLRTLEILRRAHAYATFFLVGRELRWWPGVPAAEARAGALGDHTWNHVDLLPLRRGRVRAELRSARLAIERAAHVPVKLFRPPYEGTDARIGRAAAEQGLTQILWSIDSRDSLGAKWRQIARNVERYAGPGSIVLLHENHPQTLRALPRILRYLHRHRLVPVTVPQLLRLDPPSFEQVEQGQSACYGPGRPFPG
jgi:peptidoglycan/xylan/chitin deacetylase (PgdA/CDA1 family)